MSGAYNNDLFWSTLSPPFWPLLRRRAQLGTLYVFWAKKVRGVSDVFTLASAPTFDIKVTLVAFSVTGEVTGGFNGTPLTGPLVVDYVFVLLFCLTFGVPVGDFSINKSVVCVFLPPTATTLTTSVCRGHTLVERRLVPVLTKSVINIIMSIKKIVLLYGLFGVSRVVATSLIPGSIAATVTARITTRLKKDSSVTTTTIFMAKLFNTVVYPCFSG